MNILIDIGHPAHVHFFRTFISSAKEKGHNLTIVTRNKEITNNLLDSYKIPYINISTPQKGAIKLISELVRHWYKIIQIIKKERIQIAMSISGLFTSLPATICKIPNINFTDTEDATISNRISFPFSSYIVTPNFFLYDIGKRHIRYNGLHELAYLKDFNTERIRERLTYLGMPERYVILRLVANDVLHDADIKGITDESILRIISRLQRFGKIFITSQKGLTNNLKPYSLNIPIEEIHTIMAGAILFVGESPTMAVEASLLGTPSFLLSERCNRLGNMIRLEKEKGLLRNFTIFKYLEKAIDEIGNPDQLKREWSKRAIQYRQNSVDVADMIEKVVERVIDKHDIRD